jgi:hypothetical protein
LFCESAFAGATRKDPVRLGLRLPGLHRSLAFDGGSDVVAPVETMASGLSAADLTHRYDRIMWLISKVSPRRADLAANSGRREPVWVKNTDLTDQI